MAWFKRSDEKTVQADQRRDIPDGVWLKCDNCGDTLFRKELVRVKMVCPTCGHHFRIGADDYFELLLDEGDWAEWDVELTSRDMLGFKDTMKYSDRIVKYAKKAGSADAIRCVSGELSGRPLELAVMDFGFMGGSVGSVVGEKLKRAIDRAIANETPLIVVSCSGGMRMQEGIFSLMQMAKTAAALTRLARVRLPFISILTNPTTGGTTASFSMLGDVILSEPGALIGFAGPRVIKQTIGQDLPEGFQSAEFLLEHGFVDKIVKRQELKTTVASLLELLAPLEIAEEFAEDPA